jgi:3-deoxy-D-manno-octulosonate 8-phosphate phosphatase KdsC-like HAD superfamily phosphatase
MMFVGDDYFDYQMFQKLKHTACPSDVPLAIKDSAFIKLKSKGGEGCIVELYDICQTLNYIKSVTIDKVIELDKLEQTTAEMR